MISLIRWMIAVAIVTIGAAQAPAQPQSSFVSVTGSDNASCSLKKPCRTLQAAVDATTASGEVTVLDPGSYGTLSITKAISIVGNGWAHLSPVGNTTAVTVSAGANDVVRLAGLHIEGLGAGLRGIEYRTGKMLAVVDCVVRNFTGDGILAEALVGSSLILTNVVVADNGHAGINGTPLGGVSITINRSTIDNNGTTGLIANSDLAATDNSVLFNIPVVADVWNSQFTSNATDITTTGSVVVVLHESSVSSGIQMSGGILSLDHVNGSFGRSITCNTANSLVRTAGNNSNMNAAGSCQVQPIGPL